MTGKERILTALDLKEPDRVPIWELAFNESSIIGIAKHFVDEKELPQPKLVFDMSGEEKIQMLKGLTTFAEKLELDGLTALALTPTEKVDDSKIRDDFGVINMVSEHGLAMPVEGPIRDASDLRSYKMRKPQPLDFIMVDFLKGSLPNIAVAFQMQATFKISWSLRGGMEKLLVDYYENPSLAHDLAKMVTDYCLEVVDMATDKGATFIVMDGDLAYNQGPIMSPSHYDEFIAPYHKMICDLAHRKGVKIVKHSDGNFEPLIPRLIEVGFDGIHPIQPQCMDIGEIKKKYGDKLCIMGNIDCSYLLVFGSPEEVRKSVKNTIAKAGVGGGYILSSSNSIHPGCKPENYIAIAKAVKEFGQYPL